MILRVKALVLALMILTFLLKGTEDRSTFLLYGVILTYLSGRAPTLETEPLEALPFLEGDEVAVPAEEALRCLAAPPAGGADSGADVFATLRLILSLLEEGFAAAGRGVLRVGTGAGIEAGAEAGACLLYTSRCV